MKEVQKIFLQLSICFSLMMQASIASSPKEKDFFVYLDQPNKTQVQDEAAEFYIMLSKRVEVLKAAADKATGQQQQEILLAIEKILTAQVEIIGAASGEKQELESLFKRLESKNGFDQAVASYGLIISKLQTKQVVTKVHDALKVASKSKGAKRPTTVASLMSIIITLDTVNSEKMLTDMAPFLESDNLHEVYWTLRALSSLKEKAFPLFDKVLQLCSEDIKQPSIRRNAIMTLATMGPQIGDQGFEAIENGYFAFSSHVREAAIYASMFLKDSLPASVKQTLVNDFKKPQSSILELSIAFAVLNDDLSEVLKGHERFPQQFAYTTGDKMLNSFFTYLGKDCLYFLDFAKQRLADTELGQKELGALFIVAMGKHAPAKLMKKALKILDES